MCGLFVSNLLDTYVFWIFLISMYQYIWLAFIFSKGRPHRKPFYYNWIMVSLALVQLSVCFWLTLNQSRVVDDFMYFYKSPTDHVMYRIGFLAAGFVNLLVYIIIEMVIVEWLCLKKLYEKKQAGLVATWFSGRSRQPPMHQRIVRLIGDSPNWLTSNNAKI